MGKITWYTEPCISMQAFYFQYLSRRERNKRRWYADITACYKLWAIRIKMCNFNPHTSICLNAWIYSWGSISLQHLRSHLFWSKVLSQLISYDDILRRRKHFAMPVKHIFPHRTVLNTTTNTKKKMFPFMIRCQNQTKHKQTISLVSALHSSPKFWHRSGNWQMRDNAMKWSEVNMRVTYRKTNRSEQTEFLCRKTNAALLGSVCNHFM